MAVKTDLRYQSYSIGHLSVDSLQIRGHGDSSAAHLFFPLEVLLKPLLTDSSTAELKKYLHFTLMQVWADLYFSSPPNTEFLLSHTGSKPILEESRDWAGNHQLMLPVTASSLSHLERLRTGDVSFKLQIEILLALHPASDKQINPGDLGIKRFERTVCELNLSIPKSHWVEKILPALGWGKYKLVEIRTPEQAIPTAYQKTLTAFEQAQHCVNIGDYSQAVAHCRKALEALPSVVKLKFPKGTNPTYPDKVDAFLGKLSLPQTSNDALKVMIKQMWSMTSKPHHTGVSYSRADAEFAISAIAAILAYLGQVLSK